MIDINKLDAMLAGQVARYPKLEERDLAKAIYQSVFGCGHMVEDCPEGRARLFEECASAASAPMFVEELCGGFCRVHLNELGKSGLSAQTLFRIFVKSASEPTGSRADFDACLKRLETLINEGTIGLDAFRATRFFNEYRAAGCPAVRHSEAFRAAYAPAYRVVSEKYRFAMPVFCAIDKIVEKKGGALVAIDGRCASGKTSLAALIAGVYEANEFHMDDFFLRPEQRTPARYAQPGGNVDRERVAAELIAPLKTGKPFSYRPFNCATMSLSAPVYVTPRRINIVEGSYCVHPELSGAYDLRVFLDVDAQTQSERILRRDGERMHARFINEWIPLEERYFAETDAAARCEIRLVSDTEE